MEPCALFTDVSVNPQQRLGVGACLLLPLTSLDVPPVELDRDELAGQLRCRRFTETSSTRLELQTVLWGLELFRERHPEPDRGMLMLYTDSSAIVGLPGRRERLERAGYRSGRSGGELANAALYRDFYSASDELGFSIVKVAGHTRAATHDSVRRIFSIVDREARQALKLWLAGD
ncbi:MAG TPA: hypothetical protein VFF53_07555 [Geobacteraceae bacterium]|nr:hypothetical protein [Geobacteraceae bacterium]